MNERTQTSSFSNNNFYEEKIEKPAITHNDFAHTERTSEYGDVDNIYDFLLTTDYEKYVFKTREGYFDIEAQPANSIFCECVFKFGKEYDSVEIFAAIVDFYNFDPVVFLQQRMILKYRKMLKEDLKERGISFDYYIKLANKENNDTVVQKSIM